MRRAGVLLALCLLHQGSLILHTGPSPTTARSWQSTAAGAVRLQYFPPLGVRDLKRLGTPVDFRRSLNAERVSIRVSEIWRSLRNMW